MERGVDRPGHRLWGVDLAAAGRRGRHHLPDRVHAREIALGRQPVRLHPDLLAHRHSGGAAAARAVLGHRRRARDARGADRPGRGAARRGSTGRSTRSPRCSSTRRCACCAARRQQTRLEKGCALCTSWVAKIMPIVPALQGSRFLVRKEGAADGDAAAGGARRDRDHRPRVRGRLDPGGVRGDARSLPGLHLERVRAARACARSTSCWRT